MKFRRFAPDSILGWLALILIAGLAASQALTALAHNMDRNEAIVQIEDLRAAERVATFATFLQHTAPVLRPSVASSFSGPSMAVEVANRSNVLEDVVTDRRLGHLAKAVSERLHGNDWQEIRVANGAPTDEQRAKGLMPIRTSIALRDGAWINFEFAAIESLPLATIRVIAGPRAACCWCWASASTPSSASPGRSRA
jgi:hypothetical protein